MNPNAKDNLKPFKQGFDPRRNIEGRPLNCENVMAKAVTEDEAVSIAKAMSKRAVDGDVRAADFVFDRLFGRPQQSTDLTTKGETINANQIIFQDISGKVIKND